MRPSRSLFRPQPSLTVKVFSGKLGLCGFSEHQQVSWPLTVKAVTNRRKTSMLTDTALRNLKPKSKTYKAFDRDGMYVTVSPVGIRPSGLRCA